MNLNNVILQWSLCKQAGWGSENFYFEIFYQPKSLMIIRFTQIFFPENSLIVNEVDDITELQKPL